MRRRINQWRSLMADLLQSPPRLVEAIMLLLALAMLAIWWLVSGWPYLVLSLSYLVGAIASILVREAIHPSSNTLQIRWIALGSLVLVLTGFGVYLSKALHTAGLVSL